MTRRAAPLLLLALASFFYLWRIGSAPVALASDEVIIANDAHALATTGRNLDGVFLPLYFYIPLSASWFMPAIYYLTALGLQVAPLAEWSIRAPTALVGVANIALTYLAGRRLLGDRRWGLVAALAIACAPAHFMLSRYAVDYIYPIPFALTWLLCLLIAVEPGRSRGWFVAAGLILGAGWYSYISAILLMPLLTVLTLVFVVMKRRTWRDAAAVAAGFGLPLIPFVAWWVAHPSAFHDTAVRYGLASPNQTDTISAVSQGLDLGVVAGRHVQFFTPEFLFRTGDTYLPFSTRNDGVFPMAAALLIAVALYDIARTRTPEKLLVLMAFLVGPLGAALLPDEGAIRRATIMIPFGALLAAIGAARTAAIDRVPSLPLVATVAGSLALMVGGAYAGWIAVAQQRVTQSGLQLLAAGASMLGLAVMARRMRHGQAVVVVAIMATALQFAVLQHHYHGAYLIRSAPWLNGNLRGALTTLMEEAERRPASTVYFAIMRNRLGRWDLKNRWTPAYWRFYVTKHHRQDLLARTVFLTPADNIESLPVGSLVLSNTESPEVEQALRASAITLAEIPELDREAFYTVLLR